MSGVADWDSECISYVSLSRVESSVENALIPRFVHHESLFSVPVTRWLKHNARKIRVDVYDGDFTGVFVCAALRNAPNLNSLNFEFPAQNEDALTGEATTALADSLNFLKNLQQIRVSLHGENVESFFEVLSTLTLMKAISLKVLFLRNENMLQFCGVLSKLSSLRYLEFTCVSFPVEELCMTLARYCTDLRVLKLGSLIRKYEKMDSLCKALSQMSRLFDLCLYLDDDSAFPVLTGSVGHLKALRNLHIRMTSMVPFGADKTDYCTPFFVALKSTQLRSFSLFSGRSMYSYMSTFDQVGVADSGWLTKLAIYPTSSTKTKADASIAVVRANAARELRCYRICWTLLALRKFRKHFQPIMFDLFKLICFHVMDTRTGTCWNLLE